MKNKGQVWVSDKDLSNDAQWRHEVRRENIPSNVADVVADANEMLSGNRRDFLKMLGFSLSAAVVASCDIPVKKALPYVVKPENIVPGNAVYYASSFVTGSDYCPVIVKTREGRPIKIEGNPKSTMTGGGTSARAQAMVLSLYDMYRLRHPGKLEDNTLKRMSWEDLDKAISGKLTANSNIRIVTHTTMSPSLDKAFEAFKQKYPNTEVVTYDPVSSTAMLLANEKDFGQRVIPGYRFDKADVVVSFNADFLGTWISPVEFAHQYAKKRETQDFDRPQVLKHIHVENGMSLTGSNADERILVKPSQQGVAIAHLYNAVAARKGAVSITVPPIEDEAGKALKAAAVELVKAGANGLVVSSSNNVAEQQIVNAINHLIGAYGTTLDFNEASYQRKGDDRAIRALLNDMKSGKVDAVFVHHANPVYDTPFGTAFGEAMAKVSLKVGIDTNANETNVLCDYLAPDHHMLESWGDVHPKRGVYSFLQPTINPLFDTRQAGQSFLTWAGSDLLDTKAQQPYYEFVKANWMDCLGGQAAFEAVLESGVYTAKEPALEVSYNGDNSSLGRGITKPGNSEYEISFLESIGVGNGVYSNNPWLMEMPDPVTRCSWGNYLQVPIHFDGVNDFTSIKGIHEDGAILNVAIGGGEEQALPVFRQFGIMDGTLSMTLGYGRTMAGPVGSDFGHNMYPFLQEADGLTQYYNDSVTVGEPTGEKEEHFACVQYHHTFGIKDVDKASGEVINADEAALVSDDWKGITSGFQGALTDRSIVYYTPLHEKDEFAKELHEKREEAEHLNQQTLYPYDKYKEELYDQGHHWELYIDTNKCTGCAACTISCMAENNVPIVGKKEVSRHHEMTWLRIDRYYFGSAKNPNTFYQPMMCQQCDNAPCENVCPVNATNHSSEGINQMAYNRCIGTRYCANNCPYKVRRFNWLDYTTADLFRPNEPVVAQEELPFGADSLFRMILNPDVTVRSRGVIEKCSFCVQRIQEGKLNAKMEGRRLADGDVKTACQTACPTGAIVFGDQNDKESKLNKLKESPLTYYVLEEIDVRPTVAYRAKLVNTENLNEV